MEIKVSDSRGNLQRLQQLENEIASPWKRREFDVCHIPCKPVAPQPWDYNTEIIFSKTL